jgi:chemotaxis protein methyltransferase CheR
MAEPLVSESAAERPRDSPLADLELNLLLEAVARFSGLDFGEYSPALLKRRVAERVRAEGVRTISGLQERLLHDPDALARFVLAMSAGYGTLFAEPDFFRVWRARVVPLLRTYSFTRIWLPSCGRGEDAFSLALLLHEEDLLERCKIYATDISELALASARTGRFQLDGSADPAAAHRATGAATRLADLCSVDEHSVSFGESLKRQIIFSQHSLVTDGSLNEFHVIVARGVLGQFNKALQFRVHNLFLNSLVRLGFLCLGANESLRLTPHERVFRRFADEAAIYRRMR